MSASLTPWDVFCDESGTDGGGPFFLGALYCSPRRSQILSERLGEIRRAHQCRGELKWTKVSRAWLPIYQAVADVFLDDPFARFKVMRVERTRAWQEWGATEEERFFKAYYAFLRSALRKNRRHDLYLDDRQVRLWRWDGLRFALKNAAERDEYTAGERIVAKLHAVDSRRSDLVQLVDVLLGALTATPSAEHKLKLQEHVRARGSSRITEWTFVR